MMESGLSTGRQKASMDSRGICPRIYHSFRNCRIFDKATDFYASEFERCILWDDSDINIQWNKDVMPILSFKDGQASGLKGAEVFA